jgi:hypothetical protein
LFVVYCFGRCFDGDLISSAIEDRTQTIKPGLTHRPAAPVVLRLLVLLVVVVLLLSSPEHMVVAEWPLMPHPRALLSERSWIGHRSRLELKPQYWRGSLRQIHMDRADFPVHKKEVVVGRWDSSRS